MTLTYAEFCAGYGGLGLAVEEVFGAELKWYSEFDAAPSKIMAHHWPGVPNHGDMTAIDWNAVEPVDILSGGTPCQDLSAAGRRKGMTEGTRSNLWVHMREAIAVIKPKYVVWENVRGAYSASASSDLEQCPGCVGDTSDGRVFLRALGRVLGDLSDLGYDCQWRGLRAADVGGCHGRYRVFILATHRDHIRGNRAREWAQEDRRGQPANSHIAASDPEGRGRGICERDNLRPTGGEIDAPRDNSAATGGAPRASPEATGGAALAHADEPGSQGQRDQEGAAPPQRHGHSSAGVDWREYTGAIRRWEALHGASPSPVELSPTGKPRLSAHFTEWMMGLPDGWVTASEIGLTRNEQLKACGNGVVPQQAIAALQDMANYKKGDP